MRFLFGCLLSAVLACFFFNLHAQVTVAGINGKIFTENNSTAEGATVILLKYKDSSIVSSGVAGKNGIFSFTDLAADSYLLLISKAGCEKSYSGPYQVKAGQIFTTPDISLKLAVHKLNEVTVNSTRPEIEARPGKLIINVQNSLAAQGNSVFDILRETPGVRVDNSNNINIIGRQNALITIDDKPTNLTGEDLAGVLRGMQSNMIDRIELITGGSAKYDASSGGIINIVLKKGKNTGFNGSVTGVAGYGKYYKGNAGIAFNNRTNHLNIFGNYNFTDNKSYHTVTTNRNINFNDTLSNYHSAYNSVLSSKVHIFGLGTDFYLSPNQTLGFLVNGSATDNQYVKENTLNIYNQSIFDSTITAHSHLARNITRINYNINYTARLDSSGTMLTADVNYTTFNRSSNEYITNMFYDGAGNVTQPLEQLQNLSPSNIRQWQSRIDLSDPISKTSKFEAGIKFSSAVSDNDLIFGPKIGGGYTSDPNFSDHFDYTEYVNAAYVNYQANFNKFDITVGLRAEQTIAKGSSNTWGQVVNNNYINVFPNMLVVYSIDAKNDISLNFNQGIKRPGYEDINPFLVYIDKYDFGAGNPSLKPEYTTNIEFTYSHDKTFSATLYSNIISEAYEFRYFVQNDTSKVNINIPKNFGRIYNYGLRFLVPATFASWWNADFKADVGYQRYVAYPQNGNLNKGTQDVILSGNQYFKLSSSVVAEIVGFYETPSFYGITQFKASYYANAFISKQLFNKRGSLKLSMDDIFNTRRDRYSTNYQNLNLSAVDKVETQVVKLTFTYRFGKTSLKSITHNTGNEDEQSRLNSKDN